MHTAMTPWYRQINIKSPKELDIMRTAGRINAEALANAYAVIRPGAKTADLEAAVLEVHKKYGVHSPFKDYPGPYPYPASTCISINEELVHGIPGQRILKEGDILSIDCGTVYEGYVGDSAFTAPVGEISQQARKLLEVTEQALYIGISKMVAGNHVGDVSASIQNFVEKQGFHVVREYTGHGVGRSMHEGPQVPNYGIAGQGICLREGLTVALEPMVQLGTNETRVLKDQWCVASADGSLSAHFEHTVAITSNGPQILTKLADKTSPGQLHGRLKENIV